MKRGFKISASSPISPVFLKEIKGEKIVNFSEKMSFPLVAFQRPPFWAQQVPTVFSESLSESSRYYFQCNAANIDCHVSITYSAPTFS